jgi:hypothetical protein
MPQQKKRTVKASIATMYSRITQAKQAIKSLCKQVNEVYVVLNVMNDDTNVVEWSNEIAAISPNVHCIVSDNTLGDAERYLPVDQDAIWLTCDDDLIYPKDYVKLLRKALHSYGGIVTFHGKRYLTGSIVTFSAPGYGNVYNFRCLYTEQQDMILHVPGSGVMMWDGREVDLRYQHFQRKNMADIEVGRIALDQGVQVSGIAHGDWWIRYNQPDDQTIWEQTYGNDQEQTKQVKLIIDRVTR